jgi:hypothetical protein
MKTIEEKNRMIAEFMGFIKDDENLYLINDYRLRSESEYQATYVSEMKFHISWDWLMPVVEKIENIGFSVKIQRLKTSIHPLVEDKELFGFVCGDVSKKLEITYDTIVQFIEFYNQKNK